MKPQDVDVAALVKRVQDMLAAYTAHTARKAQEDGMALMVGTTTIKALWASPLVLTSSSFQSMAGQLYLYHLPVLETLDAPPGKVFLVLGEDHPWLEPLPKKPKAIQLGSPFSIAANATGGGSGMSMTASSSGAGAGGTQVLWDPLGYTWTVKIGHPGGTDEAHKLAE